MPEEKWIARSRRVWSIVLPALVGLATLFDLDPIGLEEHLERVAAGVFSLLGAGAALWSFLRPDHARLRAAPKLPPPGGPLAFVGLLLALCWLPLGCVSYDELGYAGLARREVPRAAFGLDACEAHGEAARALRAEGPDRALALVYGGRIEETARNHEAQRTLCRRMASLAGSGLATHGDVDEYLGYSRRTWCAGLGALGIPKPSDCPSEGEEKTP